jgi:adenylylsulfate kinase
MTEDDFLQRPDAKGVSLSKGIALWFTGLSGAGKSTLAHALKGKVCRKWGSCIILDGDVMRKGINAGLGYSKEDRMENIRRIAEIASLLVDNGIICLVSTISPYPELRENARKIIGSEYFFEIFINASLEVCEERDVKGLYMKARQNQIGSFTGIQDEYVSPENPDLQIRTDLLSVPESVEEVMTWLDNVLTQRSVRSYVRL